MATSVATSCTCVRLQDILKGHLRVGLQESLKARLRKKHSDSKILKVARVVESTSEKKHSDWKIRHAGNPYICFDAYTYFKSAMNTRGNVYVLQVDAPDRKRMTADERMAAQVAMQATMDR
jgi:hypothetical protein